MTDSNAQYFIPFSPPPIDSGAISEIVKTLESGWLTTGPKTAEFEEKFAAYTRANYALALNSCTAALHLALICLNIGPGDEVITTPFTFCATANSIEHTGATPVFADVDRETQNMDIRSVENAISDRTRAIIAVHFAGRPCDMESLEKLALKHDITVIEDAAHCVEGFSGSRKIGSISRFNCFSFYATKNLCTGEGGMITLSNEEDAELIGSLRLHGMSRDAWKRNSPGANVLYDVCKPGYKYNMMDIQAALGIYQLGRLDQYLKRRNHLFSLYDEGLKDLPLVTPAPVADQDIHARHLYNIVLEKGNDLPDREFMLSHLASNGIGTAVHFTALHTLTWYRDKYGYRPEDFPVAADISGRTLSLPLSPALQDWQIEKVINVIREGYQVIFK